MKTYSPSRSLKWNKIADFSPLSDRIPYCGMLFGDFECNPGSGSKEVDKLRVWPRKYHSMAGVLALMSAVQGRKQGRRSPVRKLPVEMLRLIKEMVFWTGHVPAPRPEGRIVLAEL